MEDLNRFYTYAYLREDRSPYYVGKGTGTRIYQTNGKPCNKPPKDRIIYLKQNLTEEEAFKHEKYMIAVFGRKDLGTGILHNRSDGGEGNTGVIRNKKYKTKMSVIMKGKKWWNDGCGNSKKSIECPGECWVPGMPEEYRRKKSELMKEKNNRNYGKKWWCNEFGNSICSVECPGPNWVLGRSEDFKKKNKKPKNHNKDKKWWNDGCGNHIRSVECPGDGWVHGLSEETKRRQSEAKKDKKTNPQKWICTETGFVSTSGPLTNYQKKRGIDTSKRKRIE